MVTTHSVGGRGLGSLFSPREWTSNAYGKTGWVVIYQKHLIAKIPAFPKVSEKCHKPELCFLLNVLFKGHLYSPLTSSHLPLISSPFYFISNLPMQDNSITTANVSGWKFSTDQQKPNHAFQKLCWELSQGSLNLINLSLLSSCQYSWQGHRNQPKESSWFNNLKTAH